MAPKSSFALVPWERGCPLTAIPLAVGKNVIGRNLSDTVSISLSTYGLPPELNVFISRQHCEIEVEASGRVVVTALASQQNSNKLIRINSSEGQPGEILVNGVRNVLRLNDRLTLLWGATQASESDTRAGDLHYVLSKQEQSTAASTSSASSASSLTTVHHDGDPATQVSHASFADSLASAASTRHRSSADASVEGEDNGELPLAPPLFKIKPMRVLPPPPEGYHRKRQRKDDASPESPLATAADPSATSSSSSAPPTTSSSSSDPSSSSSSGLNPAENAAKSLDLSGLQEQFMCGICDEVMVDAWSFGCNGGHANCKQCVLPWVKQHATCPQCQSKVSLPGNRNVPVDQIIEAAVIAEVVDPEEATRYWSRRGLPAPARASSSSGPPLTLAATQGVRADSAETHAPDSAPAPSQPAVAPIFTSKRNKNRSRGSTGSSERTSSKVIDVDNNSSFNDAEVIVLC